MERSPERQQFGTTVRQLLDDSPHNQFHRQYYASNLAIVKI